jgi:hypothetical protein
MEMGFSKVQVRWSLLGHLQLGLKLPDNHYLA